MFYKILKLKNNELELSFVLVRLAVRYLNCSLPNPIPCVLDILEVILRPTEQPRVLPWEFDSVFNRALSIYDFAKCLLIRIFAKI